MATVGPVLLERAREQEAPQRALDKARENLPQFQRSLETAVEKGQTELQRRALRRLIDEQTECDFEDGDDCPPPDDSRN